MNPICCFCGGINSANTIDHVPPQACFPEGYVPENFESPACKACNEETTKEDQIFGLYSLLLNFDESQMGRQEDIEKILKLKQGIINNYPDALPDDTKAHPIHRVGSIIAPAPVAISVPTTQSAKKALRVTCRKLTHALYFRETGKIMTSTHQFLSSSYQPQLDGTQNLTSLFASLLPNQIVGKRSNIKEYGDRFRYLSGYKEVEDFFVYAAQFGHGIILWGVVCGPGVEKPSSGPLSHAHWLSGACGAGANASSTG